MSGTVLLASYADARGRFGRSVTPGPDVPAHEPATVTVTARVAVGAGRDEAVVLLRRILADLEALPADLADAAV